MTPILIPAKNIYRKQYEKLIDNLIEFVQVKTVKYSSNTKNDVAFRESLFDYSLETSKYNDYGEFVLVSEYPQKRYDLKYVYANIQPYICSASLKIKKDEINKTILSVDKLNFDVVCSVETGEVTANATVIDQVFEKYSISNIDFHKTDERIETFSNFVFYETSKSGGTTVKAEIDEEISKTIFEITEYADYYSVEVKFVCGTKKFNLSGVETGSNDLIIDISGTYENLIPQQINISIDGVLKTVDFVEEIVGFGEETSKNSFVIGEGNELMQQASVHKYETGTEIVSTYLPKEYETLLEEYKNGKKKLTLLCDINDYYYYDATKPDKKGSIAISRNLTRLTFKEYDEVIPMIKLANGDYVPIAKNEDGTPMVFVVLAIRVFYDGVVWQELTLQQK